MELHRSIEIRGTQATALEYADAVDSVRHQPFFERVESEADSGLGNHGVKNSYIPDDVLVPRSEVIFDSDAIEMDPTLVPVDPTPAETPEVEPSSAGDDSVDAFKDDVPDVIFDRD